MTARMLGMWLLSPLSTLIRSVRPSRHGGDADGLTDDDIRPRRRIGEDIATIEVAAHDVHARVEGMEVRGDVAEQSGDVVLGVLLDEGVEDGAADVACASCAVVAIRQMHSQIIDVRCGRRKYMKILVGIIGVSTHFQCTVRLTWSLQGTTVE
jgi:hypothetical protein